ncbi:hypothetical protein NQZ68_034171 [Dissostichus eleginoides]|nr:hypothetical protein NQZ68_034171 [Dissostichus eleginoides]
MRAVFSALRSRRGVQEEGVLLAESVNAAPFSDGRDVSQPLSGSFFLWSWVLLLSAVESLLEERHRGGRCCSPPRCTALSPGTRRERDPSN